MLRAMISRAILLALGSIVVLTSVASADIAPPEPGDIECPRGAVGTLPSVRPDEMDPRGRPIRAWPYCAPSTCASDAECTDGRICSPEEIGLCVEDQEVPGGDPVRNARARGCEPDNSCLNAESTCERARRCVTPTTEGAAAVVAAPEVPPTEPAPPEAPATETPAAAPESASGCACHATSRGTDRSLAWLALLPLALIARRRSH
jgi:MYXO-CTERM domain-containing protein